MKSPFVRQTNGECLWPPEVYMRIGQPLPFKKLNAFQRWLRRRRISRLKFKP